MVALVVRAPVDAREGRIPGRLESDDARSVAGDC